MNKTEKYALDAKMVVDGIAFIESKDKSKFLVVNLNNVHYKALLDRQMRVITTNMSKKFLSHLENILKVNKKYLV